MTLEDFFTLTEMKDGLTSISRVHELVSVIQNEEDGVVKNLSDASRQWAAVASTISATESKDCLDLFIQLGGHLIIARWLKDVEKCNLQTTDTLIEESITSLLKALEKLQIDKERSLASGIRISVNGLLDHGNPLIHDRAKALFDDWNKAATPVENMPPCSDTAKGDELESCKEESGKNEVSDDQNPEIEEECMIKHCEKNSPTESDEEKEKLDSPDAADSVSNTEKNLFADEGNLISSSETKVASEEEEPKVGFKKQEEICTSVNDEECLINSGFSKPSLVKESSDFVDQRKDECELDALEVARQVAQEVERQVVDYKEPSCSSSSEKILKAGFGQPGSPDSVSGVPEKFTADSNESRHDSGSFSEERKLMQSVDVLTDVDNGADDPEVSQVVEAANDPEINNEKGLSLLDLNQDVCSEDLDSEFITGRSDDDPKLKQSCLHFDLNLSENDDENVLEFHLGRQVKNLENPTLDLNRSSDDNNGLPLDFRTQRHASWNSNQCSSPASSSSSLRNFDLNDRPLSANDFSEQDLCLGNPSRKSAASFGRSATSESVFSLFGAKVEMGKAESSTKDFIPKPPLSNGKSLQPPMDVNLSRMDGVWGMVPCVPYGHSQLFRPPVYGSPASVSYMLDSRGAPVVPQILGSSSTMPSLSLTQQPFFMNMRGAPIAINEMLPSRPTFDLNSGVPIDANPGAFSQLFMPAQIKSVDEYFVSGAQASSSSGGVNIKRKEPDSGWDPYSLHYKHPQPPWR